MNLPEGWKLVPLYPTLEMINSANEAYDGRKQGRFYSVYKAMIDAAPTPPAQEDAPVAQVESVRGDLAVARFRGMREVKPGDLLYTRPDDRLRRAAEEAYEILKAYLDDYGGDDCEYMTLENLRAALEEK
jgi:hypothetical protein